MQSVHRVFPRRARASGVALVIAACCGMLAGPAHAQAPGAAPVTPAAGIAPRPADVASADAIVAALYDVISGPAGQKRDWNRFRSLFIPDARLIVARGRRDSTSGQILYRAMTPESYTQVAGAGLEQNGFFEREISQVSETFGGVTHRFSTYDSKRRADDAQPFARGINSIQLLNDGTRWWVVTIFWDAERPNNPIPEKYLKKS
jgi:hypothetical protein